jgi:hypothetical protein
MGSFGPHAAVKNAYETEDTFWLLFNTGIVLIAAEEVNK